MRLLLIGAVGLVVRVAYVLWYSRRAPLGFDANHYFELSKALADDHAYTIDKLRTALFPPGFPLWLAGLRLIGLGTRTKLLLGMAAIGTATTVLIGVLGRRLGGEHVGLIAAGIAAIYPNLFLADGALMTESLTAVLVVGALILALRAVESPTPRRFAILGVPLAYGALTRSDGVLFAVLLVVTTAWCCAPSSDGRRRRLALIGAGLVASVVLVGGWLIRNEVQMHAFVPVAVNSWDVVGGANCHDTYYGDRFGSWEVPCLQLGQALDAGKHGEIAQNQFVRDRGIDYIRAHLSRLPAVVAARLGLTFGVYDPWHELETEDAFEGRDSGLSKVGYVMYLLLIPLAALGYRRLGRSWTGRDDARGAPAGSARRIPTVAVAVVVVSTVIGYGNHRFRMPMEPVLVVLAALGARSLGGIRQGRRGRRGPSRESAVSAAEGSSRVG